MAFEVEIGEAKVEDETESGKREELVIGSDVNEVVKMTKDELKNYAFTRFGVNLDLTKKLKILQLQVATLIKKKLEGIKQTEVRADDKDVEVAENTGEPEKNEEDEYLSVKEEDIAPVKMAPELITFRGFTYRRITDSPLKEVRPVKSNYLLHTGNGRILNYTDVLAARPDCVPCDENGKRL